MALFEVILRVKHDCPIAAVTEKYPKVKMYEWCNHEHEILEIVLGGDADYRSIVDELSHSSHIVEEMCNDDKVHLVTRICTCGGPFSISDCFSDPSLLIVPPIVYEKGWEFYRVIGFNHENIRILLKKLREKDCDVELLRKSPFDGYIASSLTLTSDAIFSDLTMKQTDALLTAYRYGYFRFPRGDDLQTIAAKENVSRTTFLEHLKKAENKIISAIVPHLEMYRRIPEDRKEQMCLGCSCLTAKQQEKEIASL